MQSDRWILVVEDDPTSRQLLARLLVDMGYHVVSAASGQEALSFLYSDHPCDVLLADIAMPGMSGIELRARAGDARPGLPVVLVTGRPAAIDLSLDIGSIALCKPVTRDALNAVLDDVLDNESTGVASPGKPAGSPTSPQS